LQSRKIFDSLPPKVTKFPQESIMETVDPSGA
jgi:hypothetical protein